MKNQYEIDYQQGYDKANKEWLDRMDKIRTEIIEKFGESECAEECGCLYELLEIIDKYKAESEDT